MDNEFKQLREITDNYTVPSDVCETYEAVYNMLSELDEAMKYRSDSNDSLVKAWLSNLGLKGSDKMQRYILRNKNSITLISGILIAIGF